MTSAYLLALLVMISVSVFFVSGAPETRNVRKKGLCCAPFLRVTFGNGGPVPKYSVHMSVSTQILVQH